MPGGRTGRNTPTYQAASALFRTGRYPCHICHQNPGTTVDHDPPLSNFPNPHMWHGQLKPACPTCQSKQGNRIARERQQQKKRATSRKW